MKLRTKLILGTLALAALAAAATITTLSTTIPDPGPIFTSVNQSWLTTALASANTNFSNVNTALSTMLATETFLDCATTAACPSTAQTVQRVVMGRGTLSTGTPSTDAITTISPAFTSATSYQCFAQDTTTIANNIGVLTAGYVSGSAVTFTGPNTNTDTFRFTCVGF